MSFLKNLKNKREKKHIPAHKVAYCIAGDASAFGDPWWIDIKDATLFGMSYGQVDNAIKRTFDQFVAKEPFDIISEQTKLQKTKSVDGRVVDEPLICNEADLIKAYCIMYSLFMKSSHEHYYGDFDAVVFVSPDKPKIFEFNEQLLEHNVIYSDIEYVSEYFTCSMNSDFFYGKSIDMNHVAIAYRHIPMLERKIYNAFFLVNRKDIPETETVSLDMLLYYCISMTEVKVKQI